MRSSDLAREKPSSGRNVWDSRANKFLEVTKKRFDAVYKRTPDCTDASRLYGADIWYHSACMRNYIRERKSDNPDISSPADGDELDDSVQSNREVLEKIVASLTPAFLIGIGFTLSEVRVNELVHPNQIHKRSRVMTSSFISTRKNEPLMFFSAALSAEDIAKKVRSIDVIKDAARILQEEMKSATFGLENKHCDAFDLGDAWTNGTIKENAETFLATLLNLNRIAIDSEDSTKN